MTRPPKSNPAEPNLLVIGIAATVLALAIVLGFMVLNGSLSGNGEPDPGGTAATIQRETPTATPETPVPSPSAAPGEEQPPEATPVPSPSPAPGEEQPLEPTPEPAVQAPVPAMNLQSVGPDDRFIVTKFGIDAPLSFRVVGEDGQLGNPDGSDDVAYYNFSAWPGYGGGPGVGGNAVFAGHVDSGFAPCRYGTVQPPCEAVLWDLNKLVVGDEITIRIAGVSYRYGVTSNEAVDETADWAPIFASTAQESITVVTCGGDFNPQTHNYDKRQVVVAARLPD